MINKELYINDSLIDLGKDVIAFTYQVNDIAELQDRQANYSNEFELPTTKNNIRILGFANNINTNSNATYRRLSCSYFENGVPIIDNGFAIIKGAKNSIKVTIISGIFDFFQQISGRSINELDYSELDHDYTISDISALNTAVGNVIWPVVQYGAHKKNSNTVDIRYQCPQVLYSYVFDKIVAQTDYSVSGKIFTDEAYTKLRMTLTPDELVEEETSRLSKGVKLHTDRNFLPEYAGVNNLKFDRIDYSRPKWNWYLGGRSILVANLLSLFKDTTSGDAFEGSASPMQFGTTDGGLYPGSNQGYYYPNAQYVAKSQSVIDINFHVYANGIYGPSDEYDDVIRVFIVINDSYFVDNGFISGEPYFQYVTFREGLMEFSVNGIRLNTGDNIKIYVAEAVNIWAKGQTPATSSDYSFIQFTAQESSTIGSTIRYNSLIPDISMTDFVRNFANIFGVIFATAKNKKEIICTQFKEITENISLSNNWTDKVDNKEKPDISFRIGNYARNNYMYWASDESTAGYGDYPFQINDDTLDKDYSVFQLEFSSSVPVRNLINWPFITIPAGGNTGVKIPRYTLLDAEPYSQLIDYTTDDLVLYNGVIYRAVADSSNITPGTDLTKWVANERQYEQTITANTRLLYSRPISGPLVYSDGENTEIANNFHISYFDDPSMPHSLGFKYIQKDHYLDLIRMLDKCKAISQRFHLNKNDIKNINFLVPVYLENYQNYFYLNKVNEYIEGQSTVVDLIRL